ncbi:MAG TPA: LPS export ABC transporter ATP-binding protein [Candidatus Saccharimonadales bacterium]|nr:LPS export ABC transporter ATP-binding protein [Candidatus Saccharimonadales bacterium]
MAGLEGRHLERYYGHWKVVNQVSIEVQRGEVVGLLGPNGAGKTTTFYLIVGLLRADGGQISVDGKDITRMPMHERARAGIGYLAQEPSIFRKLTVRENILAILETLPLSRKERGERLMSLLEELNIAHLADRKGYNLSGGERRRVEITRALVTDPKFLLLDEPFVGIDPIAVGEIQDIVKRLRQRGLGILITDHNVRETLSTTDRAYIMFEGKILLEGTSQELAEDPIARQIYLGERFRLD